MNWQSKRESWKNSEVAVSAPLVKVSRPSSHLVSHALLRNKPKERSEEWEMPFKSKRTTTEFQLVHLLVNWLVLVMLPDCCLKLLTKNSNTLVTSLMSSWKLRCTSQADKLRELTQLPKRGTLPNLTNSLRLAMSCTTTLPTTCKSSRRSTRGQLISKKVLIISSNNKWKTQPPN